MPFWLARVLAILIHVIGWGGFIIFGFMLKDWFVTLQPERGSWAPVIVGFAIAAILVVFGYLIDRPGQRERR